MTSSAEPETDLFIELGLRLRKARINRRITQADLGIRSGTSRQVIIRMEQGDPAVSLDKWVKVSNTLGLLATWNGVLQLAADPFEEYDRKRQQAVKLRTTRVRKR